MLGNILVNQVLYDNDLECNIRVLYIEQTESVVYWIELSKQGGMPQKEKLNEFETRMLANRLSKAEDTWIPTKEKNERARAHREECWNLLSDVLLNEPAIYEKASRTSILHNVADAHNVSVSNLYPLLKRYWRYGKVKDAFLINNEKKGGKGKKRLLQRNTGPSPTEKATCSKILTEDDRNNFRDFLHKYYLNKNGFTLLDTYNKMIIERYSDKHTDASGIENIISYGMGHAPTFRQFTYWHLKNKNGNCETQQRKGEASLNLEERAITGKADYGMKGPGTQFQIDATIADVYLVSRFNRGNIVGRPIVYFVKDTFSRMVTGIYIGFEGPSWIGMAMALYNSFSDKVDYCHQHGIEITEDQWPCHHIPYSIIGDRGELESEHGSRLADRLGIQIDNTPPYRGDLKPIIERHFRILNDMAVHRLPGNVKPDMSRRTGDDYRLDAVLDLEQFTRIVILNTLTYNKITLKSLEPSEEMMKAGVELTPLSLWNWGIQNKSGALKTADEEVYRLALMPEDTCEITRRGIRFHKLFYSCEKAVTDQWFENAVRDGSYKMKVSYDPRDVHAIYVWNNGDNKPVKAELVNWEQKYNGKSSEECEYEVEVIEALKGQRAKQDRDAILTADNYVDSVLAEANAMQDDMAEQSQSKNERLSGIGANRKLEKEAQREQESFVNEEKENLAKGTHIYTEENPQQDCTEEKSQQDNRKKREFSELEKMIWGIDDDE